MNNLLLINGVDNSPILEVDIDVASSCDDVDNAFDDDERENFPLANDNIVPGRTEEYIDTEEPTPRSDDAEFRNE